MLLSFPRTGIYQPKIEHMAWRCKQVAGHPNEVLLEFCRTLAVSPGVAPISSVFCKRTIVVYYATLGQSQGSNSWGRWLYYMFQSVSCLARGSLMSFNEG